MIDRLRDRLRALSANLTPSPAAWRGAAIGVYLLGTTLIAFLLTAYFLQDFTIQKIPAYVVWVGLSLTIGFIALAVAWLIMRVPSSYRVAAAMMVPFTVMFVFPGSPQKSIVSGIVLVLLVSLTFGAIAVIRQDGFRPGQQKVTLSVLAIGVFGLLGGLYAIFSEIEPTNPILEDYRLDDRTLGLPNPGLPGDYEVRTLTYGSGEDLRRPEYGEDVDLVSRRVDGSKLIDNWDGFSGWLRTSYWGFGVEELPLQARVWYPEGDGPFPVVLIVHGNHGMEDFSDPGYGYLGELFASRGIIFASVDENYINSSISALVEIFADRPGLNEENDARGWLLLEHLRLWRDWNEEPGHPFEGKVDIDRVALIGHSRGGEAVGIAAAFNALDRYPDDATLDFDFGFNLRGVIAIAPVYGQYEPRDRPTPVRDVNYFTIHGDMDGDVQSFEGMAQYSRVGFSGDDYRFRAGLYVVGANHGQFNTTWENIDTGLFRAWALDLDRIMDPEAQRDVARVYFGAFLEVVLNGETGYLPIFRDARYAARWLPSTYFINQFSDSGDRVLADFEEDIDPTTMSVTGGTISATHVSKWYEIGNELKYDALDTHSVVVTWDDDFSEQTASLDFSLAEPASGEVLVVSLSAVDVDTMPDDWKADEGDEEAGDSDSDDDAAEEELLDWTIELTDANGVVASLPLSSDTGLYPLVKAIPRRAKFLEYDEPSEVLFRRFEFPLAAFNAGEPDFNPAAISRIRFEFDRSPRGAIIIDDISLTQSPPR